MVFDYDSMCDAITDVAYGENGMPEDLNELLQEMWDEFCSESLNTEKKAQEVRIALQGTQLCELPSEQEKNIRALKKLGAPKVYDIVSQMAFMYGIAFSELWRK